MADLAALERRAHRTVRLMDMRAASEETFAQERAKLTKTPVQFVFRKAPQAKLADAGRIGHVAVGKVEWNEFGNGGGVAAFVKRLAHLAGCEAEAGLHHVQQA